MGENKLWQRKVKWKNTWVYFSSSIFLFFFCFLLRQTTQWQRLGLELPAITLIFKIQLFFNHHIIVPGLHVFLCVVLSHFIDKNLHLLCFC